MSAVIEVENLVYTYPGGAAPAVKGISFAVQPGEVLGFLGPSGAGKSTTQKILTGLLKGHHGRAEAFGRAISTWGSGYYARIGVGFELPNHYLKLTALENLRYFAGLYDGEVEDPRKLLEQVGLLEDADKRVANFSKGMKMRLNFVRALLHRPQLVFLDEPTSGLDPVNARIVKDMILGLRMRGVTVFLTTHDMAVADELSDRVAFMVGGEIAMLDTPKALKLRYGRREVAVEYRNGAAGARQQTFPLDDLGQNTAFIDLLRTQRIETIHSQETTLEQIFLHVTGEELRV